MVNIKTWSLSFVVIALLPFAKGCVYTHSTLADDPGVDNADSFIVGKKAYIPPVKILKTYFWKDGGSIGLKIEDSRGKTLSLLSYKGFGRNHQNGFYWGTCVPDRINHQKVIKDTVLLSTIIKSLKEAVAREKEKNPSKQKLSIAILGDMYREAINPSKREISIVKMGKRKVPEVEGIGRGKNVNFRLKKEK